MWIWATYPKPNTSKPNKQNMNFPYLLKNIKITRINQVWSTDITYIRINWWFIYLVAVIDWYSRCVLSWELSNTLESDFCVRALENALANPIVSWQKPEIFNTDQWSQFTSNAFIEVLKKNNIQISMDWKWRYLDNIFIERLWRTVKYEEVHLKDYQSMIEAHDNLKSYFDFYNNRRYHSSLNYNVPIATYQWKEDENWIIPDYTFTHQEKIIEKFEIKYYNGNQTLQQFFLLLLLENYKIKIKNTILMPSNENSVLSILKSV